MMSKRVLQASETFYRALLHLYPAEHQRTYGKVMAQTFRDMTLATYARKGIFSLIHLWAATLIDAAISASIEHRYQARPFMSRRSVIVFSLAVILAALTGYVNITATEVQPPLICILLFSFLAGLIQPKGAWRWALLIGLSIPISTFVGLAINFHFADAPPRYPITLAILVIPALIAAYGGSFSNRIMTGIQGQPS